MEEGTTTHTSKRKRAALACNYCRKRKRKCDAKQPICSLCEEANNSQCDYREIENTRNETSSTDQVTSIMNRLVDLERSFNSLVSEHKSLAGQVLDQRHGHSRASDLVSATELIRSSTIEGCDVESSTGELGDSGTPQSMFQFPPYPAQINTTMAIPLSHSTTTGNLLRSAPARALLGTYPPDVFLHLELQRSVPDCLVLNPVPLDQVKIPTISPEEADALVRDFFDRVHRFYPILDRTQFFSTFQSVFNQGFSSSLATALVLIVLALGQVSNASYDPKSTLAWTPGSVYAAPAIGILLMEGLRSFGSDLILPQALYLSALYYNFLARPLQAWRLVHMASTEVQHYWIRQLGSSPIKQQGQHGQSILRLCWTIFNLECDIVAEYHLPRSGIENVVERLSFPRFGDSPEASMLRWLANISSRRLLNRIHYVLYDHVPDWLGDVDSPVAGQSIYPSDLPSSLFAVSKELDHQLHAWFELLPISIKPDLQDDDPTIDDAVILMRFHAAGEIIHRPFLDQVCLMPGDALPDPNVIRNAQRCLHHCRGFLQAVHSVVQTPTALLEMSLHSTMAATLLLTLGSFQPSLASNHGDITNIHLQAISLLEKWAFPGSSIETMLSVTRMLRIKCIGQGRSSV